MVRTELSPQVTTQIRPLQSERQNFIESPFEALTPRERQVIPLIAQGLSNKKIGANLFIEPKTVNHHINGAYKKLHIDHNDTERTARVDAATKYINQDPEFKNPFDGYEVHKPFTPRESEVLGFVGQGLSSKVIAEKMSISERGVQGHVTNILRKIRYDEEEQNGRVVMMLVSKAKLKKPVKLYYL